MNSYLASARKGEVAVTDGEAALRAAYAHTQNALETKSEPSNLNLLRGLS